MRLPISATIVCQDEAEHIGACIESLAGFADIVVVDSGSADATVEIVRKFAAEGWPVRLFEQPWPGYAAQKQFALGEATQPWVLNIDADERLEPALRAALPALVTTEGVAGWRIRRRLSLAGYGAAHPLARMKPVLRLVRPRLARYCTDSLVHESLEIDGPVRTAPAGHILDARALAWPEQAAKERRYAGLKARQLHAQGTRPRPLRRVLAPAAYFLRRYLAERYFLCGRAGFNHARAGAVYAYETERALSALGRADAAPQASGTLR